MDYRRSGSADERRRRVLRDEITGQTEEGSEATVAFTSKRDSKRRYGNGALAENQPRITDMVPQRTFSLVFLSLTLLTIIAGLEAAYISLGVRGLFAREARLAAFDLAARGSLAQWFAAGLFVIAAGFALVTYRLRAHRVDDFRGRYRLWILAIGACLFGSVDLGSGLHEACSATTEWLAGRPFLGMADGWWMAIYVGVFGSLGMRMAIETRANRAAISFLVFSASAFAAAALLSTGIVTLVDPLERTVLLSTSWLLGAWGIMMSQTAFARHVFLDAQGLLPESASGKAKPKRRKAKSTRTTEDGSGDEEGEEEAAVAKKGTAAAGSSAKTAAASSDDSDDEETGDDRLSKSERRRLKKIQQTTRRAA